MASKSLHLLRKYQKIVLVVMGVILMVTFTVGTSLSLLFDRPGDAGQTDPIALTWVKGPVREADLQVMRYRHNATRQFLFKVIVETIQRGGRPVVNGQVLADPQMLQQVGVGIPMDDSDPALVNTMLMEAEARRLGIVVDREAVMAHLRRLTEPELREAEWAEIMSSVLGDSRLSADDVLDQLAFELRAQHARVLAGAGMGTVPPGKIWECFNRLNRRASIEAFPIDVEPFLKDVKGEPTAEEIQKLFDEGRFRDPNPNSHEPGFRKPHKVAFEYVKVDFAPFLEQAMKVVTDEQIQKQYDLNISQGKHKVQELPPATSGEAPKPGEAAKPGEAPPAEGKPGDKPEEKKPADKAGETKAGEAKPGEAKPADAKPDEAKPANPECQEKAEDAAKPATEAGKAQEKPAEKSATTPPAADKPADGKAGETKPEPPKEQKFKPLAEVREEIRKELAQPGARQARDKAVEELTKTINAYGSLHRKWLAKKEALKGKIDPKSDPGKFDLAAAAAKYGFKTGTIPLVDRFEVANTEIGKNVTSFDFTGGRLQMLQFADIAFGVDQPTYTVQEANSIEPDVDYLYYRTGEEGGGDVTLAEARPQIVAAWKRQKAFELAMDHAKKMLAAPSAKTAKSLRDFVTDPAKVVTPPPFSWMTTSSLAFGFGMPEPSRVPGIDLSGREFMQAVFALQPGEMGVAPDQARSKVYLVRILSQEPKEEYLRTQFLESGLSTQVLLVAREDLNVTFSDYLRGIEEGYKVKWQRPPFRPSRG